MCAADEEAYSSTSAGAFGWVALHAPTPGCRTVQLLKMGTGAALLCIASCTTATSSLCAAVSVPGDEAAATLSEQCPATGLGVRGCWPGMAAPSSSW